MITGQYPYCQLSLKCLKNEFTVDCTLLLQVIAYRAHSNMACATTILQI